MKQLLQHLDSGTTRLVEVPVPVAGGSSIVVATRASLISAGTERMLVQFGRSNLLDKARAQPDKVRQVLDKARTDGIATTLDAVRSKLGNPLPLGYCHAGVVVDAGKRAAGRFSIGQPVVTNGPHAEFVRVPMTLAARMPKGVAFDVAAFTPLAAIGLQGVRLAAPTLGETVVVYGLGLIGLLTVQILRAGGCRVIGIDRAADRLALASGFGAVTVDGSTGGVADRVLALTDGIGADAVLLTLASDDDGPVHEAAEMSRKRGRIVLVGVTGLRLRRDDFYRKELSFQVSCSYGPGRYDPEYEDKAQDYPLPYVRWTEQRNFEAILELMTDGRLDPKPLISHRIPFDRAQDAYDLIVGDTPALGVVLEYPQRTHSDVTPETRTIVRRPTSPSTAGKVSVIGTGNYSSRILLPAIREAGLEVQAVASGGSPSAAVAAERFDAAVVTSDLARVFDDPATGCIFVVTRHDSHADLTIRALRAGKHVFVEKPLALEEADLDKVESALAESGCLLTVGFNRRFAPLTTELRKHLPGRAGPLSVVATINAGSIPRDHWTQDMEAGGGRLVGEAVHWIDLARSLTGSPISSMQVVTASASQRPVTDIAHLLIGFSDGSTAAIHYLSSGARQFPKERIECFFDGKTLVIDNWRRLRRFGVPGPLFERSKGMDKGQGEFVRRWAQAITTGGEPPIPASELFEVSRWAIRAAELARAGGGDAG
jgi:predicted dehydrogenase/threonine dehydrogenase-like Zn-dependent dehydrogenase